MEHLKEEVEELMEEALIGRRSRPQEHESIHDEDKETNEKLEKSVYFDRDNGMWKCRHCIWTYGSGSPWIDDFHQHSFISKTRGAPVELSLPENIKFEDLNIQNIIDAVDQNLKNKVSSDFILPMSTPHEEQSRAYEPESRGGTEHEKIELIEESEEEVIELEFDRAVQKLHTHKMYCPNCNSCITKVILRRRTRVRSVPTPVKDERNEPVDLLGCLSCFSIFIPSGNCLNLFRLFGNKNKSANIPIPEQPTAAGENISSSGSAKEGNTTTKQGIGLNRLWAFGNRGNEEIRSSQEKPVADINSSSSEAASSKSNLGFEQGSEIASASAQPDQNGHAPQLNGKLKLDEAKNYSTGDGNYFENSQIDGIKISDVIMSAATTTGKLVTEINTITNTEVMRPEGDRLQVVVEGRAVAQETERSTDATQPVNLPEARGSKSLEILKSIVYGGLMESIASLSIVSSAAASGATTMNIIVLGLANLIGGFCILGHNLNDLKNEPSRYKELLGRRDNFLLHATFAILSFFLFGLVPPITYGFTFRESNDRDLKLLAVATASLLCVFILAVGKAYIQRARNFTAYLKTIVYYLSTAILASGVSFVVGEQIKKLVDKFGCFKTDGAVGMFHPETNSVNQGWSSY